MAVLFCRYWKVLKSGWRARKRNASILDFVAFLGDWRDISMLRLLQAFLQSGPQLVLQLYILLQRYPFDWKTDWLIGATAGTSLLSMVWAILAYGKSLRDFRKQGSRLSLPGLFLQLLWRITMVTSRVVAMVLFASYFEHWLFSAIGLHWFIMSTWLFCQRTRYCTDEDGREHPCRERLFCSMIGFTYIFCFFNTREGNARKRIFLYYSIILVENSLFVSMWYPHKTFQGIMAYSAMGVVWGGMLFGALCMALYYRFYHPSSPIQGIILRKKTFDLEGQRMQTWVCCCCCRVKQSTQDVVLIEGFMKNSDPCGHQLYHNTELDILPRSASQEILQQATGQHVQRTNDYTSAPDSSVLVHSTPMRSFGASGLHTRHPLVSNHVPRITVTGPSPDASNPLSNASLVNLEDANIDTLDRGLQCSEKTPGNSDGLAEDSYIEDYVEASNRAAPKRNFDQENSKSNDRTSLNFQTEIDTQITSPKSPTSQQIISWFHPDRKAYNEESLDDIEKTTEKINYGSLSFGHRYSLVSSDCISLSTDSSQSSMDSIMFADEGAGCSGVRMNQSQSGELTPRAADEGIFSDERDSPLKRNISGGLSDVPDSNSVESTPQKSRVNAQFPVLLNGSTRDCTGNPSKSVFTEVSQSNADDYAFVELLMDAGLSPSSSLKRRRGEILSSVSSEEQMEFEEKEERLARLRSRHTGKDGHESESTDVSSDSICIATRHRSFDEIESEASGLASTPEAEEANKRHTFDFSQLSTFPRSPGRRKRERKRRRSKRKEFDNFVVTTLRPGKYGSLRRSIDRMAKIQEDAEESFLLNTEAALNSCTPKDECLFSQTQGPLKSDLPVKTKCDVPSVAQEKESCMENTTTGEFQPEANSDDSERGNFMKKKRLKRLLSKDLAPGRFSSVRLSSDTVSSNENFQGSELKMSTHMSADSLPIRQLNKNRKGNARSTEKELHGMTASLPTVTCSHKRQNLDKRTKNYPRNARNDIHCENAVNNASYLGNKDHGVLPKNRHTYDFTQIPVSHFETKEWLFAKDVEKGPAVNRQQRRCQSESMIGKTGFGVWKFV